MQKIALYTSFIIQNEIKFMYGKLITIVNVVNAANIFYVILKETTRISGLEYNYQQGLNS